MKDDWNKTVVEHIEIIGKSRILGEEGIKKRTDSLKTVLSYACSLDQKEWDILSGNIHDFFLAIDWDNYSRDKEIYSFTSKLNERFGLVSIIEIMEFELFKKLLVSEGEVIIFGTGNTGIKLYQFCIANKVKATIIAGEEYKHLAKNVLLPVKTVSEFDFNDNPQVIVIAAMSNNHLSMVEELRGRNKSKLVTLSDNDFDKLSVGESVHIAQEMDYQSIIRKRLPPQNISFILDVVEHCNLNCQCCNHFSPLSDEYYMQLEELSCDVKRMFEIAGEKISLVKIEGGEPLLHPEISEIISEIRKNIPNTKIELVTNGTLLPTMKDGFWDICKECKVVIRPTKYPINFDYSLISEIIKGKGISVEYFNNETVQKTTFYEPLDLLGRQDKYESFHFCRKSNLGCADLKHGRLYSCTFAANAHIFNKHFPENKISISQKDYIDIYENISLDDIFDFLCNPIPACRYCKVKEWIGGYEWAVSTKSIDEWT